MNYFKSIEFTFKRTLDFKGTSNRSEFWKWFLFYLVLVTLTTLADLILFLPSDYSSPESNFYTYLTLVSPLIFSQGPITFVTSLFLLVTDYSVTIRRLHDIGLSGWWIFLGLTIVGWLILIFFWVQKSNKTTKYQSTIDLSHSEIENSENEEDVNINSLKIGRDLVNTNINGIQGNTLIVIISIILISIITLVFITNSRPVQIILGTS
tara:strand:- start:138 stop:761 length:624 start_codon:yes stop_codon:yes gene_type:complete